MWKERLLNDKEHMREIAKNPTEFSFKLDLEGEKYGFYKTINPIFVFKKVYTLDYCNALTPLIANLIIPAGETIFSNSFLYMDIAKMRASRAYVNSIVEINNFKFSTIRGLNYNRHIKIAHSIYDTTFEYHTGAFVEPKIGFSMEPYTCDSGIHFFISLDRALKY